MTERIALAPGLEALTTLSTWIERYARLNGISTRAAFQLELVLTEAVTNIIEHGQPAAESEAIEIVCVRQNGQLHIEIIDQCRPFDPTALAPHAQPANLGEATPGGLGVHLIRRYCREMRYQHKAGSNHLYLTLAAGD